MSPIFAPVVAKAMPSIWAGSGGALLSGGASLLGGMMGNSASAKEAGANREFQYQMARLGHQIEVGDLRAAGLNPILSATGGSGAKASGGAQATQSDVITPAVGSALQAKRLQGDLKLMQIEMEKRATETEAIDTSIAESQARTKVAQAQERNVEADTGLKLWGITKSPAEKAQIESQTRLNDAAKRLRDIETEIAGYSAVGAKVEADIDQTPYGVGLRYSNRAAAAARGVTNAYRLFRD